MSQSLSGTQPILCAHLLREVDRHLITLLSALTSAEWSLPTLAPQWQVRDVAAHLLDTCLRKLSLVRDCYFPDSPPALRSAREIVDFVDRLNHEGVAVFRRLSPSLVIELLQIACTQSADFHESLDPFAPATFAVSWAGEATSLNWFDTARELTERWHHQQQIRLATNRLSPGIETPALYHPVLDCFLRGLPHVYRDINALSETTLSIYITGASGGRWLLRRRATHWCFASTELPASPAATVTIPQHLAWRLFTKGLSPTDPAYSALQIDGERSLAEPALHLTAIVG